MVAERGSREHISERIAKQIVDASLDEPLVEEWNLLSVVYKNAVDSRRAVWRVITSIEQNEKSEGKEQLASHAREYIAEMEGELQKIRDGILALMDKNLIPSASTDESKVLYYKMKSDYYRYLAECATDDAKGKATEDTCVACAEATKIAENPVRLAMDTKRSLKTRCSETNEEFDRRVADRQAELKAVIDAICTLNSDTSFDTYDKTVSTDFLQMPMETPQLPCIDKVVDVTVATQQVVQIPQAHVAEKTVEITQLDVVEKIVETPEIQTGHGIQDKIQQRTVEQIVDAPVPQTVKELTEVSKVFSQDGIQQRIVEQTIPATSLVEMIVEVPVIQTPSVQHVVETVEVEKPKITELTVQRKRPIIQEKINQVTKHVEFPQAQFSDKAGDMPVVVQGQASTAQTVQEAMEVSPLQFTDKVNDIPVAAQRQIPIMVQTIQKTTDIPQLQCIHKVIDVPVVSVAQAPHVQIVEKTAEIPLLQIVKKTVETPEVQTVR